MLIYSHDSFGLGHLRRCRSIALELVRRMPRLQVMILSGLPLPAHFPLDRSVRLLRVPAIIKHESGEYRPLDDGLAIEEAVGLRAAAIRDVARRFRPDIFLVDKEPTGIRGEVEPALRVLRAIGTRIVLGLRDVMDDPAALSAEWARKGAVSAIREHYDEVWVYGSRDFHQPLDGVPIGPDVAAKLIYTQHLRRSPDDGAEPSAASADAATSSNAPYLLVTSGGGGDGEALTAAVLTAVETGADLPFLNIVLGPFMRAEARDAFARRACHLERVALHTFVAGLERMMHDAAGVVAMGGYNTFCEILSVDRPALIVPRTKPRKEQLIRAKRAADLGYVAMISDEEAASPDRFARLMMELPHHPPPSARMPAAFLDGHETIAQCVGTLLAEQPSLVHA